MADGKERVKGQRVEQPWNSHDDVVFKMCVLNIR